MRKQSFDIMGQSVLRKVAGEKINITEIHIHITKVSSAK